MGENRPEGLFKGGADCEEAVSRRRAIAAALGDEGGQAPPEAETRERGEAGSPLSRRQTLCALGGAAVAAVGIGALAIFGLGRNEKKDPASLTAEITDREASPIGVAYACAADDLDGIETCGAAPNNVSACSAQAAGAVAAAQEGLPFEAPSQTDEEDGNGGEPSKQAAEDPEPPGRETAQTTEATQEADAPDGDSLYVTYRFKDLVPGKPYLFKADIMEPTYEKVEDADSYPKGWRFPKEDSTGAYSIASARKAGEASLVVVPASASGHVSCALPCAGDGSYALAAMTMLGAI